MRNVGMPCVSEALIEKTWRRVGAMSADEIVKLQKVHRKFQKPAAMFIYRTAFDFREDAAGILLYVYHVTLEAFRCAQPAARSVTGRQIEAATKRHASATNFDWRDALESSQEPHLLRYVYEAFTEDESDVVLSEHELSSFLRALDVTTYCLHDACQPK